MGKGGLGILSVDGKQVAQGRIERTIRARFSFDETMDFGEDTGTPVIEDYANKLPFRFSGTLNKFMIHLGNRQPENAADSKTLKDAARAVADVRE